MEKLNKIHINYKSWRNFKEMAKTIGIRTFAELELYCKFWKIEGLLDLCFRLVHDFNEEIYSKGVEENWKLYNNCAND